MTLPLLEALPQELSTGKIDKLIEKLIDLSVGAGKHILIAILVYVVGAFLVKLINRLVRSMLQRRHIDVSVQSFVRSHMARHKVPRYVDFMDTFPMNAAGKILKYKLREQAEQRHCQND